MSRYIKLTPDEIELHQKVYCSDSPLIQKLKKLLNNCVGKLKLTSDDELVGAIVATIRLVYPAEKLAITIRCSPLSSGNPTNSDRQGNPIDPPVESATAESATGRQVRYQLQWGDREKVARSLKFMLHLYGQWADIRRLFLQSMRTLDMACREFNIFDVGNCRTNGGYSDGLGRKANYDPREIKASNFYCATPKPLAFETIIQMKNIWNELRLTLDWLFEQSRPFMYELPPYMELKKKLPLNGRLAYSALLACMTGQKDCNKPDQNRLFGWCFVAGEYDDIVAVMKRIGRSVVGYLDDVRKKPPACSTGYKAMRTSFLPVMMAPKTPLRSSDSEFTIDYPEQPRAKIQRIPRVINARGNRLYNICAQVMLCGSVSDLSPSLILRISRIHHEQPDLYKSMRIWAKMVGKIMKADNRNSVCTVLTEAPFHVQGDDYAAKCLMVTNGVSHSGWIFMRRNWNDIYHFSASELSASELPSVADISAQLDSSSAYYFRRLSESQAASRAGRGGKSTEQWRAELLRKLRALPLLSREDSYAAGNCTPGTEQFIEQLSLLSSDKDRKIINGRELAKSWRQSRYIQEARLGNVVMFLWDRVEKQRKREAERMEALLKVREETTLGNESPVAEFTVETASLDGMRILVQAEQEALQEVST